MGAAHADTRRQLDKASKPDPSARAPAAEAGGPVAFAAQPQGILALQRSAGNQAVTRMLATAPRPGGAGGLLQREPAATQTDIQRLNEMLDSFNVPESEVIALIAGMSAADKQGVATAGYRGRLASALNFGEMMRVVTVLPLTLAQKLEWLKEAATLTSAIGYDEIRALVTAAPQAERDALKDAWKAFFVDVCTNATMVTALNDLGFDLMTKLTWLRAEMTVTSAELDYATIRPWITAASQADRDALKTDAWKGFFVDVCTNATMFTALTDLAFDLVTKLTWLRAEMTITRAELDYATIRPWILAASQAERDLLKTAAWMAFFIEVCTNATMATVVVDLGFPLAEKLRWMIAEGTDYGSLKTVIVAAPDKAAALGDQPLLLELKGELSWDDFAKCVELLGRVIPGGGALIGDGAVQGALAAAWAASNPAVVPAPPPPAPPALHEEGGFIYLDIVTNVITTDRVAAGAQASLALNDPNPPENAVTVGGYHTHPNVGPAWGAPFASPADVSWATRNGIPLLLRGAFPAVANISDTFTGPTRLHLAGKRGFPGSAGGIAPQAPLEGELEDEI
jgi:hypothetical protein